MQLGFLATLQIQKNLVNVFKHLSNGSPTNSQKTSTKVYQVWKGGGAEKI